MRIFLLIFFLANSVVLDSVVFAQANESTNADLKIKRQDHSQTIIGTAKHRTSTQIKDIHSEVAKTNLKENSHLDSMHMTEGSGCGCGEGAVALRRFGIEKRSTDTSKTDLR